MCYHIPKSISLDIFQLLTKTTNKQIRHSQPHCFLPIIVLSQYQAQRFKGTSFSLSLLYSSFLNLSFFTLFETPSSIFFSSSFSLFCPSFWNPRHSHIAPLSSSSFFFFFLFSFLKPIPFSLSLSLLILKPTRPSHTTPLFLLLLLLFLNLFHFFSHINETQSSSLS